MDSDRMLPRERLASKAVFRLRSEASYATRSRVRLPGAWLIPTTFQPRRRSMFAAKNGRWGQYLADHNIVLERQDDLDEEETSEDEFEEDEEDDSDFEDDDDDWLDDEDEDTE